jgi:integrase
MRRSELLGLRWNDIDLTKGTVSVNRRLVAVGYQLHQSPGKTRNSRLSMCRATWRIGPPGHRRVVRDAT